MMFTEGGTEGGIPSEPQRERLKAVTATEVLMDIYQSTIIGEDTGMKK